LHDGEDDVAYAWGEAVAGGGTPGRGAVADSWPFDDYAERDEGVEVAASGLFARAQTPREVRRTSVRHLDEQAQDVQPNGIGDTAHPGSANVGESTVEGGCHLSYPASEPLLRGPLAAPGHG
jgi:hypothetical protein